MDRFNRVNDKAIDCNCW